MTNPITPEELRNLAGVSSSEEMLRDGLYQAADEIETLEGASVHYRNTITQLQAEVERLGQEAGCAVGHLGDAMDKIEEMQVEIGKLKSHTEWQESQMKAMDQRIVQLVQERETLSNGFDAMVVERDLLQTENARLREALFLALNQEGWHTSVGPVEPAWVAAAREALKES